MTTWYFKPITRKLNGAKLWAADAQPSSQIRELERRNRNLIERVKELQTEKDQLNWWIGKFADQVGGSYRDSGKATTSHSSPEPRSIRRSS